MRAARNNKNWRKKAVYGSGLMMSMMSVLFLFCSCRNHDSDTSFVIEELEEQEGDVSDIQFGRELNVPKSINHKIDASISGLESVYVSDDEIKVPDVSAMYTVECDRIKLDKAYKQSVLESIFGDSTVYIYDGTSTKDDCKYRIDYCETMADATNEYFRAIYEEEKERYENIEKAAPDYREENTDFTSNQYIGMIEDQQYLLTFRADGNYVASVKLELYPDISLGDYIHADKGFEVSCIGLSREDYYSYTCYDSDELITEANECIYDLDEAMNIASAYTGTVMPFQTSLIYAEDLSFALSDYVHDSSFIWDGYNMTYIPEIEGVTQYTSDLNYVDYLQKENAGNINIYDDDSDIIMTNGAIMQVALSSRGIIGMFCDMPMEKGSKPQKADLLSWDEIIAALEASIDDYYTKHKTDYLQIRFNSIELSYYPKKTETGFIYTPVWVFAQLDEEMNEPVQLLMLDAQTGEVVEAK